MSSVRKILRNDQWQVSLLILGKAGEKAQSRQDNRLFIEAILWMIRNGSLLQGLQAELRNWHKIDTHLNCWYAARVC